MAKINVAWKKILHFEDPFEPLGCSIKKNQNKLTLSFLGK